MCRSSAASSSSNGPLRIRKKATAPNVAIVPMIPAAFRMRFNIVWDGTASCGSGSQVHLDLEHPGVGAEVALPRPVELSDPRAPNKPRCPESGDHFIHLVLCA